MLAAGWAKIAEYEPLFRKRGALFGEIPLENIVWKTLLKKTHTL